MTEDRTDADLLRLIARDHERLAPNAYHSAETLRQIADRIAIPSDSTAGLVEALEIARGALLQTVPAQTWAVNKIDEALRQHGERK
jgi:hypothetical protein